MRATFTLWRRELQAAARSPATWAVIAAYASLTGALLLHVVHAAEGTLRTLSALYTQVLAVTLPLPVALIGTRGMMDERRAGTLETLLTAPVSDRAVVLAKFAGSLTVVFFALAASVLGFVAYVETARPAPVYSRTGLGAALLLLLLHAAVWCGATLWASIVLRHAHTASVLALAVTLPHGLIAAGLLPGASTTGYVSALSAVNLARGVVDSRPILLCASLLFLALFLCIRTLEARRWRL